jgi:hypothetical protein
MSMEPGQSLQNYRLTRKIGEGGMGEVWQATDTSLDREVAIKVLPEGFEADSERLARFEREAKAVASLSHPNVLAIHDFGVHEGQAYAVMELLHGETLRERLHQGELPAHKILDYAQQIARGLAAAHERGVVHRDLKPENVFVTRDGLVKILDFGLAKLNTPETAESPAATPTRTKVTEPGSVLGTVGYMSPEQVRGEAVGHRSDIFSFGVLLYEMLANGRPFERDTAAETMTAILREEPAELERVDPATAGVVHHCLEKRVEERFQSARDLLFALQVASGTSRTTGARAAASWRGAPRGRRRWAAATLAVAALLAGIAIGALVVRSSSGDPAAQPVFERLTFARGRIDNARFDADGNTVVFSAHWRGRSSEMFTVPVGNPESLSIGLEGNVLLAVSSTGELAISRNPRLSSGDLLGTLARVPLGGSAPRDVAARILEADWLADGEEIVVLREEAYRRYVESPPGNVLLETTRFANFLRASPSGDEIAIWVRNTVSSREGAITLVAPDGETRTLAECLCTGLVFSPGGDEIWFSERLASGETTFSAVTLFGQRREIWRTAGLYVIRDIAADGKLLAIFRDQQSGVLGRWPAAEEERDLSWLDGTVAMDLSDDGSTLLFNEVGSGGGPNRSFYVRDLESEKPAVKLGSGNAVDLSPDGSLVLAYTPGVRGQYKIVPTGAGPTRTFDIGDVDSVWAWFLSDREEILINGREPGKTWRYYMVDPDGGAPRPVTPEGVDHYRGQKPVSPDGRWVAGIVDPAPSAAVWIFPLGEGDPFALPGWQPGDTVVRWSDDGQAMFAFDRDVLPTEIVRIDVRTGERMPVHTLMPSDSAGIRSIETLSLTPDGRYYAYNYTRSLDVLYVIDGLR